MFDFNEKILRLALELAGLNTTINYTDNFMPPVPGSLRELINPKVAPEADKKFKPQNYYQVFLADKGFAANLSVLDLLCNEGNNSLAVLQSSLV